MRTKNLWIMILAATLVACGSDNGGDSGEPDVAADADATEGDADVTTDPPDPDVEPDPDVQPDPDVEPDVDVDVADATGDAESDAEPPERCNANGSVACSDDAYEVRTCTDGVWVLTEACMVEHGQLCENSACVEPWSYGDPEFSGCEDDPANTEESMADKAAYYDEIARRLHIHPDLGWIMSVTLETEEVECGEGETPPCTAPVVSADEATWENVARWHTGENDGLWNGLYLASQAFRYATTGSEDALDTIRLVLEGQVDRMAITGVPGLFTRQYIPPGVDGIACPEDDAEYTTDAEKDDNRWVQIREDGCAWVVDRDTGEWTGTDHCGLDEFAGYCWLDNVSQDEYAGHMMALAALWLLVDDEDVRATTADLIEQVGVHLFENELTFVDWDGRVTEHGKLYAMSLANTPGFLAAETLGFMRMAAVVSGREDLQTFYDDCLLQRGDQGRCLSWPLETGEPYHTEHLTDLATLMYLGDEGCASNYNNFSMVMSYLWVLLQFETDPEVRELVQGVLDTEFYRADVPRALENQGNPWYSFMWASMKLLGPNSDGPAYDDVEAGICTLRQFPASKVVPSLDPGADYDEYCVGRLDRSQTEFPVPVAERCPGTFDFWRSPYTRQTCSADPSRVIMPADYLLAYWMGRYYGFIGPDE